ncbi:hypothetical protein RGQ29_022334 [Quercus rubra]|uniref:Encoded peptide n=1 Tax=Quercus rubra TaxID=3512 RepID=A0AAN7DSQ9_QUERU|nr:hypothetical protein RGQ29_032070 [Quercus rubra]KAK4584569.1 hypothetical protein RGQ29_022334 [Quercus rubra]
MALSKLISAFLFLVFILSQQIQSIEGRHLREETQTKIYETETIKHDDRLHGDDKSNEEITSVSPPTLPIVNVSQSPPTNRGVDDFRPTTPGHSPGVGHSIQN